MLKWFIIGTLLYYAIFLWRYRDSLGHGLGVGKSSRNNRKANRL